MPRHVRDPAWLETCLTGGDDYELVMAVRPGRVPRGRVALTRIGRFVPGSGVRVLDSAGQVMAMGREGWSHF